MIETNHQPTRVTELPRNVWAVSLTSFLTDISTDMVINLLPLFLANVLGVRTSVIGLIEGAAESIASLLKLFSGWLSDRLGSRKWVAVAGYAISAFSKPFYLFAASWQVAAGVRWADRVGKGVRTAPRDALIAESVHERARGLAFGFQRAADTAGAMLGLLIAFFVVWNVQAAEAALSAETFQLIVLISLIPAFLAVATLALGARDVPTAGRRPPPSLRLAGLGRPFITFLLITAVFDLGNSADAFLVLRAQERGVSVLGVMAMLIVFNLVYTLVSTPAGALSDRIGRRRVIIGGWALYTLVYLGFALANDAWQIWMLYIVYGVYYAVAFGASKAFVADLTPAHLRGTAYGVYNATLGVLDLPASVIAGVLWQGVGRWAGFGPAAPFFFGAAMAGVATLWMVFWNPGGALIER